MIQQRRLGWAQRTGVLALVFALSIAPILVVEHIHKWTSLPYVISGIAKGKARAVNHFAHVTKLQTTVEDKVPAFLVSFQILGDKSQHRAVELQMHTLGGYDNPGEKDGLRSPVFRRFIFEIVRLANFGMDETFHWPSRTLAVVNVVVVQRIYSDALTKDMFMQRVTQVHGAIVVVLGLIHRTLGDAPPAKPNGLLLH